MSVDGRLVRAVSRISRLAGQIKPRPRNARYWSFNSILQRLKVVPGASAALGDASSVIITRLRLVHHAVLIQGKESDVNRAVSM